MDENTTAIIEALGEGFAKQGTKLEAQMAELNELAKKNLEPKPADPPAVLKPTEQAEVIDKAEMKEAGVIGGITSMEVWDIPIGQALVGGFVAIVATELVDGFLANQSNQVRGLVKLVGAGVAVKWGKRFLGSTGSKAVALLLAYDGIRSLIPLDEWAGRLSGAIVTRTGGGLAGKAGMGDVQDQMERVVNNYAGLTSRVG